MLGAAETQDIPRKSQTKKDPQSGGPKVQAKRLQQG